VKLNLIVNSIYSYIYGRNYIKANNDDHEEQENEQNENIDTIDVVPLKQCDNSDNSIFIVDESHLISDNLYESFDLRFGSGHLLKDYLEFTDFKNSHRKIIFIGDPFQLSLGNNQESPLHRHYLEEKYQLIVDVAQLLDKPSYSLINNEFLKCVSSIRKKIFNHLCIAHIPDIVIHLQKEEISDYLSTLHKTDIHIISYSNEKSNEINLWIKRKLLNSGENISVGDIILFHNNINVANDHDLFAPIQPIYNGDFAEITEIIESSKKEEIITKNTSVILKFITVDIQLTNTRKICRIFILENYLTNPKGELNKEEIIALKILLNGYLKKEISHCPFESSNEYSSVISSEEYRKLETEIDNLKVKLNNGEKVKTKLSETEKQLKRLVNHAKKQYNHKVKLQLQNNPSSKYFQLKNIAFIKYGYAMTVHKAMSYKWSKVIFNADQGENRGRTNESYFKWLYTGITRATSQIILYGCSSINPLSNPELKIQNLSNQKINKDWVSSYFTSKQCSDIEQLFTTLPDNLKQDFVDEFRIYEVIDICLFISRKIECSDLKIQAVKHKQYQEIYEISDILNPDKTARVIIYYDKNGRFKAPTIQKSSSTEFADYVLLALSKKMAISQLFLLKQDTWREKLYNDIFEKLKMREIYVEDIFENNYYDLLKLFNVTTNNQLCIKIDYNGEGFISTITAIDCEDLNLWNYFQEIIQEYN
jgi:hypothetical protein